MESYYSFTDLKGKLIEVKVCVGRFTEAEAHRKALRKKLKKVVIAWAHMGQDNPEPLV